MIVATQLLFILYSNIVMIPYNSERSEVSTRDSDFTVWLRKFSKMPFLQRK